MSFETAGFVPLKKLLVCARAGQHAEEFLFEVPKRNKPPHKTPKVHHAVRSAQPPVASVEACG
jgi:hypothetical protein